MTAPGFNPTIRDEASRAQDAASDPSVHVFVEANAGSGKTRVLVDRVIRILLSGVAPDRILCVTYTKAAAAEMKDRLFARLGRWSVMQDDRLEADLGKLGDGASGRQDLGAARRLFARALETPGGLKIQTIHAFCENLLRRFPLEAGAPPGFSTLEESEAARLADRARRKVLSGTGADLVPALIDHGGLEAIDKLTRWCRIHRLEFLDALERAGDPESLVVQMRGELGIADDETAATLSVRAWNEVPLDRIEAAALAMHDHGSKTDRDRSGQLARSIASTDELSALTEYLQFFFKDKGRGDRYQKLATKTCLGAAPQIGPLLEAEADRMERVRDEMRTVRIADGSATAIRFAAAFLEAYDTETARARSLGFDDLIRLAGNLLRPDNAFAGWVGYKLDGSLVHALVDEAQDTSPGQWSMIRGLTSEFFSGEGASSENRTLFVVGDEKQSIYSFQGAEPAEFLAEGDEMERRASDAGAAWRRPGLAVSFRSSPEVLEAVDQAFDRYSDPADAAPEVKFQAPDLARPFSHYRQHIAARENTPGCVELWPAVPKPERVEENSIFDPVDQVVRGSAREVLASAVAREISEMIARRDAVWQETDDGFVQRPVQPRDIAILVARRTGGFFEEVIRQLKICNVPVAGPDRMVLRDQTAVRDLLALGRFAVSSSDDLALAVVLKSPFFDPDDGDDPVIDDDALFDLAQARTSMRRGTLWPALLKTADPRFIEARDALASWRNQADSISLYEAYSAFLNARTPSGETRWARLFARLGEEARDAVEEFLSRALLHEREQGGAVASFVASIENDALELKREMSAQRNEVQVMTVHASKGLERPVIILPDTTQAAKGRGVDPIFAHHQAGLVWSPSQSEDSPIVARLREAALAKREAEHGRLLYVALTRARDRLIVCGWRHGHGVTGQVAGDSWYAQLERAWSGEGWKPVRTPVSDLIADCEDGIRLGPEPVRLPIDEAPDDKTAIEVPAWARTDAETEASLLKPVAPSSLLEEAGPEPAVLSPLADPDGYRYRRGELIHKLLETLPDLPADRRRIAAERFLAPQLDVSDEQKAIIVTETLAVLDHPDFASLFGPGSRAEVGLSGTAPELPEGVTVRGQVDRLVVTDAEVLIVDYKTNRPPPSEIAAVAKVYLGQMAAYRAILRVLHPDKTIRCALLWTDEARLMEVPAELMDSALGTASA